jgi:uncharacterized protein YegP (UPF0339 family)
MKFEIHKSVHGEFYWILLASNGQVLADSGETYTSKQNTQEAIALIQAQAAQADVEDLSIDKDAGSLPSQVKELGSEVASVRRRAKKTPARRGK